MLSILIPTYNYNVWPLVKQLYEQCSTLGIDFELLVYDDCSPNPVNENSNINSLKAANFVQLPQNIGRSAIRNKLAHDAKYEDLLFLDADTMPVSDQFIQNYLSVISTATEIIYGGIIYQKEQPQQDQILRWVYGNKREALPVSERNKMPHLRFLTLNFCIKKTVFQKLSFNEDIPNLRHEDTLFAMNAKQQNIAVLHIDNPIIHHGLESSEVFLKKSEEATIVLKQFVEDGLMTPSDTALSYMASRIENAQLKGFVLKSLSLFKSKMKRNLLSKNPSLFIFDLYRLQLYLETKGSTNE
ncbi:MAG: hypothetical protein BM564_00625 [Bacteroidetes bacterium MedPE-SWsnd-G2]|nr:MAG: hypothetical protein BM564_00625 [Bacteroidetes bacterium MedPE-SWsnd-G2]